MRKITVVFLVALLAAANGAWAQMNVRLQLEQDTFLLYEAIPVVLSIQNYSGRTIELADVDGKSWLSFIVTDESGNMVDTTKAAVPNESLLVPAGQTARYSVDILPLYDLRRRGNFKVQVFITGKGVSAGSVPVRFTIMHGRQLHVVTQGLPPREGEPDQYRTYALVARATHGGDQLYALVRDDANQRVFELVPLGNFLPTMDPSMRVDREGGFHVLFQSGPRAFGYALITTEGRMLERKVYADYGTAPELVLKDGMVHVSGGEQVYPKPEHIMTEEELNPPPPPPAPAKKKPWWKFWGPSGATSAPPTMSQ